MNKKQRLESVKRKLAKAQAEVKALKVTEQKLLKEENRLFYPGIYTNGSHEGINFCAKTSLGIVGKTGKARGVLGKVTSDPKDKKAEEITDKIAGFLNQAVAPLLIERLMLKKRCRELESAMARKVGAVPPPPAPPRSAMPMPPTMPSIN